MHGSASIQRPGIIPLLEIAERPAGASRQCPGWVFGNLTSTAPDLTRNSAAQVALQHERWMNGRYRIG